MLRVAPKADRTVFTRGSVKRGEEVQQHAARRHEAVLFRIRQRTRRDMHGRFGRLLSFKPASSRLGISERMRSTTSITSSRNRSRRHFRLFSKTDHCRSLTPAALLVVLIWTWNRVNKILQEILGYISVQYAILCYLVMAGSIIQTMCWPTPAAFRL